MNKEWWDFKKKESEEVIMPVPQKQTTGVWKPRCLLQNAVNRTAGGVPNINDQEMFPTFEDAKKIEKLRKDDEKKRRNDGFTTVTSDRDPSGARAGRGITTNAWQRAGAANPSAATTLDRAALFTTVKQVTSSGAPNPTPPAAPTQARIQPQPLQTKNPNAYVPPSRRRAQANATKE
ncbi:unnamed protein product, partial [Gongylonema pulchrum]|uniref:SUZ domain-containing protein n=1 Tax=Gongylonema pulchrum TaxID=637853 RepID=A0A183D9I6_9BILA